MKVIINNQKAKTIGTDLHCSKSSLNEMIKSTNQNVKRNITIDKVDNFSKTFTISYAKTHKKRKYYPD